MGYLDCFKSTFHPAIGPKVVEGENQLIDRIVNYAMSVSIAKRREEAHCVLNEQGRDPVDQSPAGSDARGAGHLRLGRPKKLRDSLTEDQSRTMTHFLPTRHPRCCSSCAAEADRVGQIKILRCRAFARPLASWQAFLKNIFNP